MTLETRLLFRIAPIHLHFEMSGWPETRVMVRFLLLSAAFFAQALVTFIADFTEQA